LNKTVLAYRAGARLARLLPRPLAERLAAGAAAAFALRDTPQRQMVTRHLRRATGHEPSPRLLRRTFGSYARYWVEALRLPSLDVRTLEAGFRAEGFHHIDEGLARGKGVILALPHLGGWEFAGFWLTTHGYRTTVVVEAIEPPELFDWFRSFREALGMTVVALGPEAGPAVLAALRANEIVCLLSDRDLVGGGIEVDFFGERTTLPGGPVTLALRTGAPVLPTAVYFEPHGGHLGLVGAPLPLDRHGTLREDVARHTQALATALEGLIRRAPEQWHLLQPNWPSDRNR
jgi:lauroyl/myristoyl acyltransferase